MGLVDGLALRKEVPMPRPVPMDAWLAEAADRFAEIAAWRQAHGRAGWDAIETTVDAELARLRAQVLQDTVLASDAVDLRTERPPCPASGRPKLVVNGRPTAQHPSTRTYRPPQPIATTPSAKL